MAEKKTVPIEEIREVPPSLDDAELASSNEDWQPGFWRHFPWLGFFSVIVIVMCTLGSVLVLVLSDDVSDRHWRPRKLPPSVWLSGFNNISNIFFGVAIGKKSQFPRCEWSVDFRCSKRMRNCMVATPAQGRNHQRLAPILGF